MHVFLNSSKLMFVEDIHYEKGRFEAIFMTEKKTKK